MKSKLSYRYDIICLALNNNLSLLVLENILYISLKERPDAIYRLYVGVYHFIEMNDTL